MRVQPKVTRIRPSCKVARALGSDSRTQLDPVVKRDLGESLVRCNMSVNPPSQAFIDFQDYLQRKGSINLARLEDDLRTRMQLIFKNRRNHVLADSKLAHELLLRYCFAWKLASQEDLCALASEDDYNLAYISDKVQDHADQLSGYSGYFSVTKLQKLLQNPEQFSQKTKSELISLIEERAVSKGVMYSLDKPLFQEDTMKRLDRDYMPPMGCEEHLELSAATRLLLGAESERTRYRVDHLARLGGISTGKIAAQRP